MFKEFLNLISDLDYVVQRNWHNLPNGESDHPDLDIFVSSNHIDTVNSIASLYDFIDVRFPGDGYYPPEIEKLLLQDTETITKDGVLIKVPNPLAHFLSLYYHNLVHKENDPYHDKLKELFLTIYPPVKPVDTGVGYYV